MPSEILERLGIIEYPFKKEVSCIYPLVALRLADESITSDRYKTTDRENAIHSSRLSNRILDYVHSHHSPHISRQELEEVVRNQHEKIDYLTYISLFEAVAQMAEIPNVYREVGKRVVTTDFRHIALARTTLTIDFLYRYASTHVGNFTTLVDMWWEDCSKHFLNRKRRGIMTKTTKQEAILQLIERFGEKLTEKILDNDDEFTEEFLKSMPTIYTYPNGVPKPPARIIDKNEECNVNKGTDKRVYTLEYVPTTLIERIMTPISTIRRRRLKETEISTMQIAFDQLLEREEERRREAERREQEKAKELDAGREFHRSHLPKVEDTDKLSFGKFYESTHDIGGDIYDVLKIDDENTAFYVADVTGHGLPQSYRTLQLLDDIRSLDGETKKSPGKLLSTIQKRFGEKLMSNGWFITMAYFVINNNGKVRYCNAGHEFYRVFNQLNGKLFGNEQMGGSSAFPIGFPDTTDENYTNQEREFQIERGDILLLYTDGFWEEMNPNGEQFGEEKLVESFRTSRKPTIEGKIEDVIADLKEYSKKTRFSDDLTMIGVQLI